MLLVSGFSSAQDGSPQFLIHTADGGMFAGPLRKLGAAGVRLGGDRPALVPLRDIVRIRRKDAPLPPFPRNNVIILTNGNHLPWQDKQPRLAEGRLHFAVGPKATEARVPRSFVSVIWRVAPDGQDADLMLHRLSQARRASDVLYLRNGDRLDGRLLRIDDDGFTMESANRPTTVDAARVACLAFSTELQARFRPTLPYYHVIRDDGSRIDFSSLQLESEGGPVQGKTLFGTKLKIALDRLAAIEPRHDKLIYLSELTPQRYEYTPYLDLSWPLARDAAVSGQPLFLAGNTHDKGLGMHARSRVRYALDGGYRWFEALVGIDRRIAPKGRARIRVLLDGKEQALGKAEMVAGNPPLVIRLDVRKIQQLTLETDFAGSDVHARVNWADARLLR